MHACMQCAMIAYLFTEGALGNSGGHFESTG
jgi:hypothetical protein